MERTVAEGTPCLIENAEQKKSETSENFQRFIHELFDKNGILNDLRAYLRGHIVNLLKNAQTGDLLPCQKHFTQRLEHAFQALNILIVEYLLCMEFSFSLSVFVSEIPLANMVFEFAKTLIVRNAENDYEKLRFTDNDIWCILNYLGIKCDSEHALNVREMYKREENSPLLLCLLKCMSMNNREAINISPVNLSEASTSSSVKSSLGHKHYDSAHKNTAFQDNCKHYVHCGLCQYKITRLKEKYRRKKKDFFEMFEQLKTVYEAELGMVKAEEHSRAKKAVEEYASRLQRRRDELEEQFKIREQESEKNVQQKKRFLWGLARALREQHAHMAKAMDDVRAETERLAAKEESLKSQIAEAEQLLRERGEDMRLQISNELIILEQHLESMRNERDNINKERVELEQLKSVTDNKLLQTNIEREINKHHELLKDEFAILKKYVEATKFEPKCVIERATLTDSNVTLNNKHVINDDQLKSKQVVNDLKKSKNVNFNRSNIDEYRERSASSASSEAGRANYTHEGEIIKCLRKENERLETFSRQQRDHIDELRSQQARLQAELTATKFQSNQPEVQWRPRTAPTVAPPHNVIGLNISPSLRLSQTWQKTTAQQFSAFSNAQPKILVPGHLMPFIGIFRNAYNDTKSEYLEQSENVFIKWEKHDKLALKCVLPALFYIMKANPIPLFQTLSLHLHTQEVNNLPISVEIQDDNISASHNENQQITDQRQPLEQPLASGSTPDHNKRGCNKIVEKCSKSSLKEAKQRLKNKETKGDESRDKNPNTVLKEAKLRLRKLEIEAEAVEQSYMEFRKRQAQLKEKSSIRQLKESVTDNIVGEIDAVQSKSIQKLKENAIKFRYKNLDQTTEKAFEKYLKNYETNLDIGEIYYKNKNTAAALIKPIPECYRNFDNVIDKNNYLETPLNEFRKFYNSDKRRNSVEDRSNCNKTKELFINCAPSENFQNGVRSPNGEIKFQSEIKRTEFKNFKENTSKIHNFEESNTDSTENRLLTPVSQREDNLKINHVEQSNLKHLQNFKLDDSTNINITHYTGESNVDNLNKDKVLTSLSPNKHCDNVKINNKESNLKPQENDETEDCKEKPYIDAIDNSSAQSVHHEIFSFENSEPLIEESMKSQENLKIPNESNKQIDERGKEFLTDKENIEPLKSIIRVDTDILKVDIDKKTNLVDDSVNEGLLAKDSISDTEINKELHVELPLVSPKNSMNSLKSQSISEQAVKLTLNVLDAISNKEDEERLSNNLENSVSDVDKVDLDDFSADVDYYNSRSEYENDIHSPVSVLMTSDDENFWGP